MSAPSAHLLHTTMLTFEVIEDDQEAQDLAVALVALLLESVEPAERMEVGAALIAGAIKLNNYRGK